MRILPKSIMLPDHGLTSHQLIECNFMAEVFCWYIVYMFNSFQFFVRSTLCSELNVFWNNGHQCSWLSLFTWLNDEWNSNINLKKITKTRVRSRGTFLHVYLRYKQTFDWNWAYYTRIKAIPYTRTQVGLLDIIFPSAIDIYLTTKWRDKLMYVDNLSEDIFALESGMQYTHRQKLSNNKTCFKHKNCFVPQYWKFKFYYLHLTSFE